MSRSRGIAFLDQVPDGLHQVRLAHAHTAIQKQRVVGLGRLLGDGLGRGVRELVRCAHDKRIKRVARIELMIDRIEIQARLLHGSIPCRGRRFILRAQKIQVRIAHAHFGQHGLQQLAVGFRQSLAEYPGWNSYDELAVFRSFLASGAKPRGETVRVNPPFHVLQNFFPGIHSVNVLIVGELQVQPAPEESEKSLRQIFPQLWKYCG